MTTLDIFPHADVIGEVLLDNERFDIFHLEKMGARLKRIDNKIVAFEQDDDFPKNFRISYRQIKMPGTTFLSLVVVVDSIPYGQQI